MKQSKAFMRQKIFGPPRQRTFFSLFCRLRMAGMILIVLLSACSGLQQGELPHSASEAVSSPHMASDAKRPNIQLITNVYGFSNMAVTNTGSYEILPSQKSGSNIIYTDFDSKTRTFLCSRPECLHTDESCSAWIASSSCQIFTDGSSHIFIVQSGAYDSPDTTIWEAELNGSNRTQLFQFHANQQIVNAIAADENSLYITVLEADPVTYQLKKLMYQIDMQTGEAKELFSMKENDWLFGAYEDNLILLSYDSAKREFVYYRYCVANGARESIFSYSAADEEKTPVTAVNENILYLIQPIGNHKAEVSRIDLKSDEKQTLCTGIPFFSSETTSVLDFVDNKLILLVSDTLQQDPQLARHYQYGIDLKTGEVKEASLLIENGGAASFLKICGEYQNEYCVLSGYELQTVSLFGTNGEAYQSSAYFPIYAFITKEDYWSGSRNLTIPVDFTKGG